MPKLPILTEEQMKKRDEALRHEANSPVSLQEQYYANSVMTRPLPLSDNLRYHTHAENRAEEQEMNDAMLENEPTLEEIKDLVKLVEQKIREIGQIQTSPEWNEHERADKINYRLNQIVKYRKTIENWFNLQIANSRFIDSRPFNLLFKRYNKTK